MPDDFFHHHQVTKMGMTGWHKSGKYVKRVIIADRIGNSVVIPMAKYDPPFHKIRDFRKQ